MAGAALRGFGRALLKKAKPSYPKAKPRGTPTKAGLVARRSALRGETTADKYRKLLDKTKAQPKTVKAPKIPDIKKTTRDIGKGAIIAGLAYAAGKSKATKEAEAKADKKELEESNKKHKKKTKEASEKHENKTKEKRKKYGKHHG